MDNMTLFFCGVVVTLVAGMGVITSEVFLGYKRFVDKYKKEEKEKVLKSSQFEWNISGIQSATYIPQY